MVMIEVATPPSGLCIKECRTSVLMQVMLLDFRIYKHDEDRSILCAIVT